MLTLLDLVTLQRNDVLTGLVEDVTQYAPEFHQIPVVTRPGTTYKIVKRTQLPGSGFRPVNQGVAPGQSQFKQEVKEMFYLDAPINIDEAIVKGDDRSVGDIMSIEAQGLLQSSIITIGTQTYYGTKADASGFAGLRSQISGNQAAGGTTNSTSAYLLWLNPQGVHFDVGRDGEIAMPPFMRQQIPDPNNSGKNLFAWVSNISAFIGLSVNSNYSVWAVTGITTHQTSTVYDQLMSDPNAAALIENVPLNRRTGMVWFMNRRSHRLLQQSRSALNYQVAGAASATPAWSPPPVACEGFPIQLTDSILNTEDNT